MPDLSEDHVKKQVEIAIAMAEYQWLQEKLRHV